MAVDGLLYNCAALVCRGRAGGRGAEDLPAELPRVLRGAPVHAGDTARAHEIDCAGQPTRRSAPTCIFRVAEQPRASSCTSRSARTCGCRSPPSSYAALAGATVVANLSASNVVIGKEGYRHQLVGNQSARCLAAYLYSAAGLGESTTDLAWDGHALIYENGTLLAESERFADTPQLAAADVDLGAPAADRMRQNTFGAAALQRHERRGRVPQRRVRAAVPGGKLLLERRSATAALRAQPIRRRATRAARRSTASR